MQCICNDYATHMQFIMQCICNDYATHMQFAMHNTYIHLDQNNSSCGIHFSKVLVQIHYSQFREAYWWTKQDSTLF